MVSSEFDGGSDGFTRVLRLIVSTEFYGEMFNWREAGEGGGGGGGYSFVACLNHLAIDHASLPRRSTVPTPNRYTSNIWALFTACLSYPRPVSPSAVC